MSTNKVTIPKSFISASIKAFCHPDPSADHKTFKCEITLETGTDKNMPMGCISVLDRQTNIIVPIISGENLVKVSLLKSDVPIGSIIYSTSDFERFRGNCFAQWSNFQHNQESSKSKQPSPSQPDTRIIKVLFEFIVDTAGNIKVFQEQRNRFGEISEKQSEIEDNSVPALSQETSFVNQEPLSSAKHQKNSRDALSKRDIASDEAKPLQTIEDRSSKLEKKASSEDNGAGQPNLDIQEQKAPCPSLTMSVRKSEASVCSPIKKQIVNSKCTSYKNSKGPSHVSSTNTSQNECVATGLETITENIKESQSQNSILPLTESKVNVSQEKIKKDATLTQTQQDKENVTLERSASGKLAALNQKLMANIKDEANSSFFLEFLSQLDKFSQEFRKIQSENDSLKTQVKRLETTLSDDKVSTTNSRVSLVSTESKASSQLNHKSSEKTFEAKSNLFYELNKKISLLEKRLKQKEDEIHVLREENKILTSHGQHVPTTLPEKKKKAARTAPNDDFVAKLKAENDKLKETLLQEQAQNAQKHQDLLEQLQKTEAQEKKIKKMNEKMKQLDTTLRNATKAISHSEVKKQKVQRDANNLSLISNTASQKAKEELYQLDCGEDEENVDDIPGFINFKKTYPQKTEPKCQKEFLQVKYTGDGMYDLGNKKVYIKKLNGNLFVRIGGGFVTFQEFLTLQKEPEKACSETLTSKEKARSLTPTRRSPMSRLKDSEDLLEAGFSSKKKEKKESRLSLEAQSIQKGFSSCLSTKNTRESFGKNSFYGDCPRANRSLTPNAVKSAKSVFK